MLRSHSLVRSIWLLSYNSNGNNSLQSHKPTLACGMKNLFHSRPSDSASSIHSYQKAGKSAEKVIDDEPDFNIDLENELKWLNDRVRNSTSQSASGSLDIDSSQTPLADHQETSTRGWHKDLTLSNSQLWLNVLPQNSRPVEGRAFPAYREQCARVSSDRRPPPLTTDVAVEVVTSELKAVFGLDRYYAHRVASWLRRPHYANSYQRLRNKPQLPSALDTDPAATEALVALTLDTIQALHQLGATPWQLYHLPMLVKMSSKELLSNAPLLVGPGLFSEVFEGLPLLLMPRSRLQRALNSLRAESRYLSQHRNRLYFMADALKVCVGTVCCGAAVAGAARMLEVDLIKLARAVDTFNYYRLERRYILTHMNVFLVSVSEMRRRYDLLVRATNPPHVVAALHAASLLPAHTRVWPSFTVSLVLEDTDTGKSSLPSGNTDTIEGRGNSVGQNGVTAAAKVTMPRVGKAVTRGYSLPNGGGNRTSEALKATSGELGLEEDEAADTAPAAVNDPLTEHAPLAKGEGHTSPSSTVLKETVGGVATTTPAMGYYEKNIFDNYAMKYYRTVKSKSELRPPGATDDTTAASPTNAAYSLSAEELEDVLKDYVPPLAYAGRLSKSVFKALYNRQLGIYGKKPGGEH